MKNFFDFYFSQGVLLKLVPALFLLLFCLFFISKNTENKKQILKIHVMFIGLVLVIIFSMFITKLSFFLFYAFSFGMLFLISIIKTISYGGKTFQEKLLYSKKDDDGYFMIDNKFLMIEIFAPILSFSLLFAIGFWARKFYIENNTKTFIFLIILFFLFQAVILTISLCRLKNKKAVP